MRKHLYISTSLAPTWPTKKVADMELDIVTDMEVDKVANIEVGMVANIDIETTSPWKSNLVRELATGVG